MNMHSSFELKNHHFIAVLSFLTLLLAFNQLWVIEGDKKGFYLSGIFAGLAFLTKGIVSAGILIISFILIFDLKKASLLKRKEIWLFILISLLIPSAFFIAQYHVNGEEFFKKYFFGQVFQSIKEGPNPSSPFYYLGYILVAYLPWLPFFLHGIGITLRDGEKHPLWRMTLFWCAVIFISFSVASSKRYYYLLPMFPAMSLLTGRSLDRLLTEGKKLIFFRVIVLICVSASLFLAISPIPLHRNSYPEIYKMAPYLKEVLTENDLIISYRNGEGISTPSFYLINDKLKIEYCYKPEELQELIKNNKTKRIILCTSDKNVEDNPKIIEGFFPFIENNGLRFYSNDPNVKPSGHIY